MRDRHLQRRRLTSTAARRAFTLLEVTLTLGVMVVIAALTWPTISRVFDTNRLRAAGDQMRAEFGQARSRAMSTGLPHVFRFEPNTANYEVTAWADPCAPVEAGLSASQSTNSSSALGTATSQSDGSTTPQTASGTPVRTLPQGITFLDVQRSTDSRAALAEEGLAASGQASAVPPILFYPDGTTSDAVVKIGNDRGKAVEIFLRGLTGIARMGEVTNTDSPTGGDGYTMPTYPNGRNPSGGSP